METEIVRQFLLLSGNCHMTETARKSGISQSSLSKNIAHLEAELGFPLFDRLGRRLRLSARGEQFAVCARQALETLDLGTASLLAGRTVLDTPLLLVCDALPALLAPALSAFAEEHPGIPVQLLRTPAPAFHESASSPQPDMYILSRSTLEPAPQPGPEWEAELLMEEPVIAMGFRGRGDGPDTFQDLCSRPLAVLAQEGDVLERLTAHICRTAGVLPRIAFRTDDLSTLLQVARLKSLSFFLPARLSAELPADGFALALPEDTPRWQFYALHRPVSALSGPAADVLDCLRRHPGRGKTGTAENAEPARSS